MNDFPSRVIRALRPSAPRTTRLLAAAFCAATLSGCGSKDATPATDAEKPAAESTATADSAHAEPASSAEVAATVELVKAETYTESIDASGTVAVRAGNLAALSAPAPTRITAVLVSVGSRVRKGERLVSFEQTTFDAAVASADAALNAAELAAQRARRLVDAGVSPRKDAELAASELAAARANSVTAHRAQQLAVLESPINGVVTRLNAQLGANVDAGQTLAEVADMSALEVQLTLAPALAAKTRSGQSVVFRDGATADAAMLADGRVADVSAVVDSSSRGVLVRVAVSNAKRPLRIGENVYGQIRVDTHRDAVVVPDGALVPVGDGFQVFVVDAEKKAHATAVTIGGRTGHRVWITDGVKAGDSIVTTGAYGVDDGATVVTAKPKP